MSETEKNKNHGIEITEMWLAEAGDKCFYGIIKRSISTNGAPHLFSRITINDGNVQACASHQEALSRALDELCIMYLNGLHSEAGFYIEIFGDKCYIN